jgi:short subunit dehydrogenase-like uncharacterized protein
MLYGANGFTGELIAEQAVREGEKPILAGRNREAVERLARRLDCPSRGFALSNPAEVARQLNDVDAVLLAAGPFARTSAPMREACLRSRVHYLDITGEFEVFEQCFADHHRAVEAGITILPGVGFDVVPSDCLAVKLFRELPDSCEIALAFKGAGSFSRGTLKTMLLGAKTGVMGRVDGKLLAVPPSRRSRKASFGSRELTISAIPWGDISTAFHSTGIPNITVYMATPRALRMAHSLLNVGHGVLLSNPVSQKLLPRLVDFAPRGPGEKLRSQGKMQLWGEAKNAEGRTVTARLWTREGYQLTVETALECVHRVRSGGVAHGATTPASAFGPEFIESFDGCQFV